MKKKDFDMPVLSKALSSLALRLVVSVYIAYLGWKTLMGMLKGSSPIVEWVAWLIFAAFGTFCVFFSVYAVKQYLSQRKAAILSKTAENEHEKDGNTQD